MICLGGKLCLSILCFADTCFCDSKMATLPKSCVWCRVCMPCYNEQINVCHPSFNHTQGLITELDSLFSSVAATAAAVQAM